MRILIQLKMYLILPFFFTLGIFSQLKAQDYFVFHLTNGEEIIGQAFLDTLTNQYIIETLSGKKIKLEPSKIVKDEYGLFITNYERVMLPPIRKTPPNGIDTCRISSSLHLSAKGVLQYVTDFSFGGEINLGFRWGDVNFGIGGGVWNLKDEYRYPVFVYVQKFLMNSCIRPSVIANVGYIFDNYKIKPSFNNVTKISPKFASLGLGLDLPLLTWFDVTIDAGYKYLTIPTDREAASCDGPIPTVGYIELHVAYLRLGISF